MKNLLVFWHEGNNICKKVNVYSLSQVKNVLITFVTTFGRIGMNIRRLLDILNINIPKQKQSNVEWSRVWFSSKILQLIPNPLLPENLFPEQMRVLSSRTHRWVTPNTPARLRVTQPADAGISNDPFEIAPVNALS